MIRSFVAFAIGVYGCGSTPHRFGVARPTGTNKKEPPALNFKHEKEDGSNLVSDERAAQRRGYDDQRFSERVTSMEKPIEVCGFEEQLLWLTAMHCDDGSRPWGDDIHEAHRARRGSGFGDNSIETCNKPVDIYEVACPEKTDSVHINIYLCPANEGLLDNWGMRR
jgi:hypothetical protein